MRSETYFLLQDMHVWLTKNVTLNVVDIDLHLGQELTVSLLSLTPFIFPIIFPIISYAIAENISCMLIVRGFMCGSSATDVCICVMPSVRNHTIYSRIVLLLMSYFLRSSCRWFFKRQSEILSLVQQQDKYLQIIVTYFFCSFACCVYLH